MQGGLAKPAGECFEYPRRCVATPKGVSCERLKRRTLPPSGRHAEGQMSFAPPELPASSMAANKAREALRERQA